MMGFGLLLLNSLCSLLNQLLRPRRAGGQAPTDPATADAGTSASSRPIAGRAILTRAGRLDQRRDRG